nr:MAG TPA_asm: hypothetical protein [Caudoviricetes sp.]DAN95910.1 MAG TPA: hypothetical protein [Caudoviricetes sp.]DAX62411.1 MAG TPA: hypothetical protein [Caudoviricetes sp.]
MHAGEPDSYGPSTYLKGIPRLTVPLVSIANIQIISI